MDRRAGIAASVAVWQSCRRYISVGELLRNYQPCADSLKVNIFSFSSIRTMPATLLLATAS